MWEVERSDRTRWLSSFESVDAVMDWLLDYGIYQKRQQFEDAWGSMHWFNGLPDRQGVRDYKLVIYGRRYHKPYVKIFKRLRHHPGGESNADRLREE